jgi:hypothetical protein
MNIVTTSHRFAEEIIIGNPGLRQLYSEIVDSLNSISDEMLIEEFNKKKQEAKASGIKIDKSLSPIINKLINDKLVGHQWVPQSSIFQGSLATDKQWRLDFCKKIDNPIKSITGIAVEVAFNHGEAILWNLLKPVIASEINHVQTQTNIGSGIGVVICATDALKAAGGFDDAVGEYEKILRYLEPFYQKISTPVMIIGLEKPSTFYIKQEKNEITKRKEGTVVKYKNS